MSTPLKILLLEDSEDDALLLLHELRKAGYLAFSERVDTREAFEAALENGTWDVITADYAMPLFDGLSALSIVKEKKIDTPFIIVSGKIGEELAVQAMRNGACDYILKSNLTRLAPSIEREVREAKIRCQKKKAEEALHLERERLAVTLASIGDGVIATDIEAKIVIFNQVAENLTGWTQEEAIGRPLLEVFNIVNEETRQPAEDPVAKSLKTGLVVGLANHTALIARDGSETSIADSCAPIRARDGSVIGAVLIFRDVTEEYRAQRLNRALNDINFAISSTLDFNKIMQSVIVEATQAIGADAASINLRERDAWVTRYVNGFPAELLGKRFTDEQYKTSMLALNTRQPVIINDAHRDERVNQDFVNEHQVHSKMILPLRTKDEAIGSIIFYYVSAQITFTEAEIDFANKLATSISLAVDNARLYAIEHAIADTLQNAILTMPTAVDGIDFGHLYRSAAETAKVGGDFYDIFLIEDSKIGIIIGDVAGKGIQAATLTSTVKNILRVYAHEGLTPAKAMERTNDLLIKGNPSSSFVTVFFGILDTVTGRLTYCSAGHPPALLKRKASCIEVLKDHSPVIGALKNFHYDNANVALEKGDTLVLYTDGVTEARNKDEFFGEVRLIDLVNSLDSLPAREMPQVIFENISGFTSTLADDIAILTIAYAASTPTSIN